MEMKETIQVYPNPILGNNIFISANTIKSGVYAVTLVNSMGQTIIKQSISHTGGALKYSIPVSPSLPKGVYTLHISGNDVMYNRQLLK
jgi:hypothetical protein